MNEMIKAIEQINDKIISYDQLDFDTINEICEEEFFWAYVGIEDSSREEKIEVITKCLVYKTIENEKGKQYIAKADIEEAIEAHINHYDIDALIIALSSTYKRKDKLDERMDYWIKKFRYKTIDIPDIKIPSEIAYYMLSSFIQEKVDKDKSIRTIGYKIYTRIENIMSPAFPELMVVIAIVAILAIILAPFGIKMLVSLLLTLFSISTVAGLIYKYYNERGI